MKNFKVCKSFAVFLDHVINLFLLLSLLLLFFFFEGGEVLFLWLFFTYIKKPEDSSAKYYREKKDRPQKIPSKGIKIVKKTSKIKRDNIVKNNIFPRQWKTKTNCIKTKTL